MVHGVAWRRRSAQAGNRLGLITDGSAGLMGIYGLRVVFMLVHRVHWYGITGCIQHRFYWILGDVLGFPKAFAAFVVPFLEFAQVGWAARRVVRGYDIV